jgi:tRNA threonylcarbamoyladenosine biosynthesis protein TsaB
LATLFIDSTYDVTLGLLDDDRKWIDLRIFKEQKSSVVLQTETFNLLKDHSVAPKSLTNLVHLSGPGFYTGLRLSEGFCDVFKFFGVPQKSFYSYEIPKYCGVKAGVWVTKAYRGEYFFHAWKEGTHRNEMVSVKDFESKIKDMDAIFIHSAGAMDELSLGHIPKFISTRDLIEQQPQLIFSEVIKIEGTRESFYFRPPEDEYKANP